MPTYYAAVEGDPLTSGKGGQVFATKGMGRVADETGRQRRMVYIGDPAYCSKCNSPGVVTYGAPVNEKRRMIDLANGGRRQAVGGDIVLCRCAEHPRIIAAYGRRFIIHDNGATEQRRADVKTEAPADSDYHFDQHFVLRDERTGAVLANRPYTIVTEGGRQIEGRTDSKGRTLLIKNDAEMTVTIHILEETPPLRPDWDRYQATHGRISYVNLET